MPVTLLTSEELAEIVSNATVEGYKKACADLSNSRPWLTTDKAAILEGVNPETIQKRCKRNYYGEDQKRAGKRKWLVRL